MKIPIVSKFGDLSRRVLSPEVGGLHNPQHGEDTIEATPGFLPVPTCVVCAEMLKADGACSVDKLPAFESWHRFLEKHTD